jgi:hypothetical protein
VSPPDHSTRDLGAGLAVGGLVIGGVGSALTLYALAKAVPCSFGEGDASARDGGAADSGCPGTTLVFIGLGGMATGLALGIPGVVLLVKNSRPSIDSEPYAGQARAGRFYLGLGSGSTLAGVSLGAHF